MTQNKQASMLRKRLMLSLVLLLISLTTGCQKEISKPATAHPILVQYSPAFLARLTEELEKIKDPPCLDSMSKDPLHGCSSVKTVILDYLRVRDQIRSIK